MEVTNNKVIEVLQYLSEKFGIVADWTSDNIAPYIKDLIQRIATYEFYSSLFFAIALLILFFVCCIFLRYFSKQVVEEETSYGENILYAVLSFFCVFGIVLFPIVGLFEVDEMIKAKTLPEVVAIEYLHGKAK